MVMKKCFCGKVDQMTNCDACRKPMCRKCAKHEVIRDTLYIKHDVCLKKRQKR